MAHLCLLAKVCNSDAGVQEAVQDGIGRGGVSFPLTLVG